MVGSPQSDGACTAFIGEAVKGGAHARADQVEGDQADGCGKEARQDVVAERLAEQPSDGSSAARGGDPGDDGGHDQGTMIMRGRRMFLSHRVTAADPDPAAFAALNMTLRHGIPA